MRDLLRYVHFLTNGWGDEQAHTYPLSGDCQESNPHFSLRLVIYTHNQCFRNLKLFLDFDF